MSQDILLLALMCGMTLLAYMIALNAQGSLRLIVSYFLATILLVGTVWVIIQHVNIGIDTVQTRELHKLEQDKEIAEKRAREQADALQANRERVAFARQLTRIGAEGSTQTTSLITVNLQDKSADLHTLIARSVAARKKAEALQARFGKLSTSNPTFREPMLLLRDGIRLLVESTRYYQQYYYSEDPDQETLRERIMRQKARNANEKFQKAALQLSTGG